MTRATNNVATKARHKKILKMAKGYRGRAKNCFTIAIERVERALQYSYRDRRTRRRDFRGLWIQRINAASRLNGITYSNLIRGLKLCDIEIDRKILAELAVKNMESFKEIAHKAKVALGV